MKKKVEIDPEGKPEVAGAWLIVQATLLVELLVFVIFSYFVPEIWLICQIILVGFAFLLAYNNYKVYRRLMLPLVYAVLGLVVLASIFL